MGHSLSHGKALDVGDVGINRERLPQVGSGPVELGSFFPNELAGQPVELEIGSGKGTFLVGEAQRHPSVNYIGLEYARAFWRHAADRCRRHGLRNVRVVHSEAGAFLRQYAPDGSLSRAHIYFPDPWPKARHHKRRLIQAPFLRLLHAKLRRPGRVHIVTDHGGYYEWILEHAAAVGDLYSALPFDPEGSADEGELVGTNFERKYRREGRVFNAITLTTGTT